MSFGEGYMNLSDQITAAIGAHGLWKGRLKSAIDNGKSDVPVSEVGNDHHCSFGKWLYGPELDSQSKKSTHYKTCADLHRRFHAAAAGVMSLAIAGKKKEAHDALEGDHDFPTVSRELTRALVAWKEASAVTA
jgi:methyl-accepting chemotaxis protein